MTKIHGGHLIARSLARHGVDTLFTLTGGHILPILDGCVEEGIRVVDFRHEQAAAHAAEAYGRLTGSVGVAAVTAGPGVTDTITAIANAWSAGTPMLVLGGRHLLRQELKGGLQEMDHPKLVGSITAWSATAWQAERLGDYIDTAMRHALAGRGGPVFLDVPMDVQFDQADEDTAGGSSRPAGVGGASGATVNDIVDLIGRSSRPIIFAGAGTRGGGENLLRRLAETIGSPTFVNGRARGSLPHDHPLLGNHARSTAFREADLVLALGVDWDFRTGYGEKVNPDAVVVQVDATAPKIGWNRPATLGVVADPMTVVDQLVDRLSATGDPGRDRQDWCDQVGSWERERQAVLEDEADDDASPVMPQRFGRDVAEFFGPDAIVAVDGGDIVSTTARWLQVSHPGHVLDPGPFGTLGTGPPFAIAAKLAFPSKRVGIVFGDGAFGFNGFEYDTMVRHGLAIVGVMGNDGVWANIKTLHKAFFPERVVAADLGVRPYHRVVESLGGYGEMVTEPDDLIPALRRAEEAGVPALVNVHLAETMRASSNYAQ